MTRTAEIAEPPIPVVDPSCWLAEDLTRDTSWIDRLSAEDTTELDHAVGTVLRAGFGECAFNREDFPLPTLEARIAKWAHDLDHGRGCVLVRGLDPARYNQDALLAIWLSPPRSSTTWPPNIPRSSSRCCRVFISICVARG